MKLNITILVLLLSIFLVTTGFADDIATNLQDPSWQAEKNTSSENQNNLFESAYEEREMDEKMILRNPFALTPYKPNYVLPFYFTGSPYKQVYVSNTPNNEPVKSPELKAQFSFEIPILSDILGRDNKISAAYTQKMYWQVYAASKYFRETNYNPEIFFSQRITPDFWLKFGAEHESNGRGGDMERSWNRAYVNVIFAKDNFMASLRPWLLIFKKNSSDLYNPNISDYLGHGEIILSYKFHKATISLTMRNNIESGFKRGGNELDISYPITSKIKLYTQLFSGYGQSLIEYDHFTNSAGIGVAFSDWI